MTNYKVKLWQSSQYCRVNNDPENCIMNRDVEARSRYEAADKAVRTIAVKENGHRPKVYEIREL